MTKRAHISRSSRADRKQPFLPALSALTEVPDFDKLLPTATQREAYETCVANLIATGAATREQFELACVVRLDRGFPAVAARSGVFRAEFAARVTKGAGLRVAVGDWVCARVPGEHDMGIIAEILPRKSEIARWRGSARGEKQTLAANIDTVFVVQALDKREISIDRIVRSTVIALDSGIRAVVVLTKADALDAALLKRSLTAIREVLDETVSVVVTSSKFEVFDDADCTEMQRAAHDFGAQWGIDAVRGEVPQGSVAMVLGESGAGKSTLLNALLGHDALETGEVRVSDREGRHTTVARRMVSLPGAGVIVDEPGLRSLPVVGHECGLARVFPKILSAAQRCKFRDCTHTHEPGCAVQAALQAGEFPSARLEAYLLLAREMRSSAQQLDPDVVL